MINSILLSDNASKNKINIMDICIFAYTYIYMYNDDNKFSLSGMHLVYYSSIVININKRSVLEWFSGISIQNISQHIIIILLLTISEMKTSFPNFVT